MKQRARKAVSFAKIKLVRSVTCSSTFSQKQRSMLWYQQAELQRMKSERADDRQKESLSKNGGTHGFDNRSTSERRLQRAISVKVVLKAQKYFADPQAIAKISKKCSARATHAAMITGRHDFLSAHFPSLLIKCTPQKLPAFPVSFTSINEKLKETTALTPCYVSVGTKS